MLKRIFTNIFLLLVVTMGYSQVLLNEDFESSSIPVDWQNISNATDGGWKTGTSQSLSSQYFPIESNGSIIVAIGSSFPELSSTVISTLIHGEFNLGLSTVVEGQPPSRYCLVKS